MNRPDSIARQQICDAISNFQTPTCDPLKVSPWLGWPYCRKQSGAGKSDWPCKPLQRFSVYHLNDCGGDAAASHSKISA